MENIKVTVCCTAYNQAKYIRQCLDGLVNQICSFKYDVLVHDDASDDGTKEIIREYEEKYKDRIRVIYQEENKFSHGISVLKEYVIPNIKGDYAAFCEGDDYWTDPHKLQKQYDAMVANPDCSMCVAKVIDVNENGMKNGTVFPHYEIKTGVIVSDDVIKMNLLDYQFHTTSYFIKGKLLNEYYNESPDFAKKAACGDIAWILYFATKGNYYYINEPMSCHRASAEGSWTSRVYNNNERRSKYYKKCTEFYSSFNDYSNYKYSKECTYAINKYNYMSNLLSGNYKEIIKKEYKIFFDKETRKQKIKIYLSLVFPFLFK